MNTLKNQLLQFPAYDEREQKDIHAFVQFIDAFKENIWTRDNCVGHISSSAWVLNRNHTHVLMAYHNIFQNYAWLGGHADGDKDLLHVAIKETKEESGVSHVKPILPAFFDVCAMFVAPHIKRGEFVASHTHYNVTYLLEADDRDTLSIAQGENSDIKWVLLDDVLAVAKEPHMLPIYSRLIEKSRKWA